jgi:hydrogenase maturation protease
MATPQKVHRPVNCSKDLHPETGRRSVDDSLFAPKGWALVAGIGNVLRCDDGFGPAVLQELEHHPGLPQGVVTIEVGIGGIGLVLELLNRYQVLVIVDAVDRGGRPGQLYELEPLVPDTRGFPSPASPEPGMDMHQIGPGNALVIAHALGVLPPVVRMVGCQPGETEIFSTTLSHPVQQSLPAAVRVILSFLKSVEALPGTSVE